ncbi:hypothetical protein [Stutzerimonas stutzeri]|uniref:hypothetical protein n=1 Tax=Stutzerimonas stutzeri TaxID=316 RepID=UPI00210E758E|nr:hypothetical protein [Stutzerimonas stutzeri]MCQ4259656.1 hypothetical protein [Stutzerimonas stutzeri]
MGIAALNAILRVVLMVRLCVRRVDDAFFIHRLPPLGGSVKRDPPSESTIHAGAAVGWVELAIPIGEPPGLMGIAALNAILRVVLWCGVALWGE